MSVMAPSTSQVIYCTTENIKLTPSQLVKKFEPLAHKIVRKRLSPTHPDYPDLIQEAFITIMHCYNELTTHNNKVVASTFINYTAKAITNRSIDLYKKKKRSAVGATIENRISGYNENNEDLSNYDIEDTKCPQLEEQFINQQCIRFVTEQIQRYSNLFKARNIDIVRKYILQEVPLKELAQEHELSEIAIYKITIQTLEDIKDVFEVCEITAEDLL